MHLFAESIHAAVAEHRASEHRRASREIERHPELPRHHPFVPVAADVGDVAVLFGEDDERELRTSSSSSRERRGRRDRDARRRRSFRSRALWLSSLTIETLRAGDGLAVIQARHEDQRVLRAVLDGDAEIRDLDIDARTRYCVTAHSVDRLALTHRGPDDPGRPSAKRGPEIQPVRFDAVGRAAETPLQSRLLRASGRSSAAADTSAGIKSRSAIADAHCRTFRSCARRTAAGPAARSHTPCPSPKLMNGR